MAAMSCSRVLMYTDWVSMTLFNLNNIFSIIFESGDNAGHSVVFIWLVSS